MLVNMKWKLGGLVVLLCQAQIRPGTPIPATTNLPDEFTVDISLETPIDSNSASAGDPISAHLLQSIKVEKTSVPRLAIRPDRADRQSERQLFDRSDVQCSGFQRCSRGPDPKKE